MAVTTVAIKYWLMIMLIVYQRPDANIYKNRLAVARDKWEVGEMDVVQNVKNINKLN